LTAGSTLEEMTVEWLRKNDPFFSYRGKGKAQKIEYPYYSKQAWERRIFYREITVSNLNQKQCRKLSVKKMDNIPDFTDNY